jgi:hypothetical protein
MTPKKDLIACHQQVWWNFFFSILGYWDGNNKPQLEVEGPTLGTEYGVLEIREYHYYAVPAIIIPQRQKTKDKERNKQRSTYIVTEIVLAVCPAKSRAKKSRPPPTLPPPPQSPTTTLALDLSG